MPESESLGLRVLATFIAAELIAMVLAMLVMGALIVVDGAAHYLWPGIEKGNPQLFLQGILRTFLGFLYAVTPVFFFHEFLLRD